MTDAGIYYDEHGNELKKFCTKDAVGFLRQNRWGLRLWFLPEENAKLLPDGCRK